LTSLHIGFVSQGWAPDVGGIESHTSDLVRELLELGHRVSAICLDYTGKAEPFGTTRTTVGGVEVTRMSYGYHDHDSLAKVVRNRSAEQVFAAWLDEVEPDVLHVHHLTGFGLGVLTTAKSRGVKQLMTLHDYWPICPRGQMFRVDNVNCEGIDPTACGTCLAKSFPHVMPSGRGKHYGPYDSVDENGNPSGEPEQLEADDAVVASRRTEFALHCLHHADLLATPSARTRDIYIAAGLHPDELTVVENGIDVQGLRFEVDSLKSCLRPRSEVRLGILGTVLPSKGVLELAQVFAELKAEGRATNLVLEIHGHMPSYHGDSTYVESLLVLDEQTPDLHVMGPFGHGALGTLLSRLDGVAAPSRWEEVFGLTVREARAAGLPVLVSDAGGLPSVADGGAGLVVSRDDRQAWKDAIALFAEDDAQRAAWANSSAPVWSAGQMAVEYVELYRSMLSKDEVAQEVPGPAEPAAEVEVPQETKLQSKADKSSQAGS
jgi:glycosyltransferase involved in cell wall biosynthesis